MIRCAKNVKLFQKSANSARLRQQKALMSSLFVILVSTIDWEFVIIAAKIPGFLKKKCADSAARIKSKIIKNKHY